MDRPSARRESCLQRLNMLIIHKQGISDALKRHRFPSDYKNLMKAYSDLENALVNAIKEEANSLLTLEQKEG